MSAWKLLTRTHAAVHSPAWPPSTQLCSVAKTRGVGATISRRLQVASLASAVVAMLALGGCGGQGTRQSVPVQDTTDAQAPVVPRTPKYETDDGVIVQALPSGETSATPLPSQTVAAVSPELSRGDSALSAQNRPANPAVAALLRDADAAAAAGAHDRAAASIERALKVEPRSAELWRRLAQAKLAQGQSDQAENLARRSSSLAPGNRSLLISNWHLIAAARDARGDGIGANEALALAAALE